MFLSLSSAKPFPDHIYHQLHEFRPRSPLNYNPLSNCGQRFTSFAFCLLINPRQTNIRFIHALDANSINSLGSSFLVSPHGPNRLIPMPTAKLSYQRGALNMRLSFEWFNLHPSRRLWYFNLGGFVSIRLDSLLLAF